MKTQKELKEAYKQKKFRIGVFQIRNLVNGKILVASSLNLDAIWNRTRMELNFGGYRNEALQAEWKELGETGFAFEILSELTQKEDDSTDYSKEVRELEKLYIDELQPFDKKGYHKLRLPYP
ncbi:GIY-YIG nuclease family protein [Larkinella terrae]|uniref:GIY-YIG nuclease family protein n=1 Tax=Larkinella terrae TaxID=2025311 RepID=A0A7K0EUR5_9BACT|nr:GIY-YIG nuclease family protein [Larkinella terrae]MRS65296.1 GIY-YIG nuclease family protein [Larkinella terrae]